MRSRRTLTMAAVLAALALVAPAAAAAPPPDPGPPPQAAEELPPEAAAVAGLPKAAPGHAWFIVTNERRTDTAVDPASGRVVTTTGVYEEFVLAPASTTPETGADALRAQVITAAGCGVSAYRSDPYRNYYGYPNYKYGPRAYAWKELTAGCTGSGYFHMNMDEDHGIYTPVVASGTAYAPPGAGRKYLYIGYTGLTKCEGYFTSGVVDSPYVGPVVRICP